MSGKVRRELLKVGCPLQAMSTQQHPGYFPALEDIHEAGKYQVWGALPSGDALAHPLEGGKQPLGSRKPNI